MINLAKSEENSDKFKIKEILVFLISSIIGIVLFLLPLNYGGNTNIGVGYLADVFKNKVGFLLPTIVTIIICISAILSLIMTIFKPNKLIKFKFVKEILYIKPAWLIFRCLGAIFSVLILTNIGPGFITSDITGGTILFNLIPTLATWFLISGFFLPILLDFGIMDFFGTLIKGFMRPLFLVPGRSAIDAIASWIGSGPVGVVLTNNQLKEGYYTKKEAAIISVCFSLVSLPFATVLASFLDLSHVFLPFYITISFASLIAAIILPRIYPLCKIKDEYINTKMIKEDVPEDISIVKYALSVAIKEANTGNSFSGMIKSGLSIVLDVYFCLMPIVVCFGTISLVLAEYTPIFNILSYPIVFILQLLNIPGATQASPAVLIGFADMFLPSVLISNVEFEMTRFIIGALSFTQLIYMTETGAIILKSDIPLNIKDLFIIFIERTVITLPIITLIAHMIF